MVLGAAWGCPAPSAAKIVRHGHRDATVTRADQFLGQMLRTDMFGLTNCILATADDPVIPSIFDAGGNMVKRERDAQGSVDDAVLQWSLSLPGGSLRPTRTDAKWSYPNLHGDSIILTDHQGLRLGHRAGFDPFGQPIDPVTGDIGTVVADDAVTDTAPGEADYAFVGQHRKLYEHQGSIATIEMGARQYVPALGRFLEVDPIEGGVSNDYDYRLTRSTSSISAG